MITNHDKNLIRHILTDPAWKSVESLKDDLIRQIQDEQIVKDSEWETVKTLLTNQGQIAGINRFINELLKSQL